MAVVDVYDALVSKRVYREALSHDQAIQIIVQGNGTQFDPAMVEPVSRWRVPSGAWLTTKITRLSDSASSASRRPFTTLGNLAQARTCGFARAQRFEKSAGPLIWRIATP
jgi:hypothetical protein